MGLSELSRAVDISKPTCLGIVTTLTQRGRLSCDPRSRAHRVGPALEAAGRLARPIGLRHALWDSPGALERWLRMRPVLPLPLDHAHRRTVVAECRGRGYLVEGLTEVAERLRSLMAGFAAYDLPEVRGLVGEVVSTLGERVYLGAELTARGMHPTHLLAAPTYGSDGRQEMVLTLYVGAAITGAEISRRGKALMATAAAVTDEAGGTVPRREVSA